MRKAIKIQLILLLTAIFSVAIILGISSKNYSFAQESDFSVSQVALRVEDESYDNGLRVKTKFNYNYLNSIFNQDENVEIGLIYTNNEYIGELTIQTTNIKIDNITKKFNTITVGEDTYCEAITNIYNITSLSKKMFVRAYYKFTNEQVTYSTVKEINIPEIAYIEQTNELSPLDNQQKQLVKQTYMDIFKVTYHIGEQTEEETITYKTPFSAPKNPQIQGGVFSCWVDKLNNPYNFSTPPISDVELFAKFTMDDLQVVWKNYNGKVLKTETISYGAAPSYLGDTPIKNSTALEINTFSGWDPTPTAIYQNTEYTALFLTTKNTKTDSEYFSSFTPVIRFSVCSDVHIKDSTSVEESRLSSYLDYVYSYANSQSYKKVDLSMVAGDMCDSGSVKQFSKFHTIWSSKIKGETYSFLTLGNHEIEFFSGSGTPVGRFTNEFGCTEDEHTIINGYHFIRICPSETCSYSQVKQNWLKTQLDIAKADTPDKPIFVVQHHPGQDTCLGSKEWGDNHIYSVLKNYPQVVNFSGHSHYTVADPTSIWQGDYTSINVGGLSYFEGDIIGYASSGIFPSNKEGGYSTVINNEVGAQGEFLIVEVDAFGAMVIKAVDVTTNTLIWTKYFRNLTDKNNFKTNEQKKNESHTPEFNTGAEIKVEDIARGYFEITFPQANKYDNYINSYRIELSIGSTNYITDYLLGDNFFNPIPQRLRYFAYDLEPNTTYTVKIYGVNAYGKNSVNPLVKSITTSSPTLSNPLIFDLDLSTGVARDSVSGTALVPHDNPSIEFNNGINRHIAVFNGYNNLAFTKMKKYYDYFEDKVSMECLVYVNGAQSEGDFFANMQVGGFGFEVDNDEMRFYVRTNAGYVIPKGKIELNKWCYVVGTYDGSKVRLFINGELVDSINTIGDIIPPRSDVDFLSLGSDSGPEQKGEFYCNCKIGYARLLLDVLDDNFIKNKSDELVNNFDYKVIENLVLAKGYGDFTFATSRNSKYFKLKVIQNNSAFLNNNPQDYPIELDFDLGHTETMQNYGDWVLKLWKDHEIRFWNYDKSSNKVNMGKLTNTNGNNQGFNYSSGISGSLDSVIYNWQKVGDIYFYNIYIPWSLFCAYCEDFPPDQTSEIGFAGSYPLVNTDKSSGMWYGTTFIDNTNPTNYMYLLDKNEYYWHAGVNNKSGESFLMIDSSMEETNGKFRIGTKRDSTNLTILIVNERPSEFTDNNVVLNIDTGKTTSSKCNGDLEFTLYNTTELRVEMYDDGRYAGEPDWWTIGLKYPGEDGGSGSGTIDSEDKTYIKSFEYSSWTLNNARYYKLVIPYSTINFFSNKYGTTQTTQNSTFGISLGDSWTYLGQKVDESDPRTYVRVDKDNKHYLGSSN